MKSQTKKKGFNNPIPERLIEAREASGYTMSELAKLIGVSRQAISLYELGHTKPSGPTFAKIVETLDFPLPFYFKEIDTISVPTSVAFFRSLNTATKKARTMTSKRLDWLWEIFSYLDQYIDFPKVNIPNLEKYLLNDNLSEEDIENIAETIRKEWGLGFGPINNMIFTLEAQGFIVSKNNLKDDKIDACSKWYGKRPFIFKGSSKSSAVRSRYDDAHELAHLLLHSDIDEEQLAEKDTLRRIEKEANLFAAAFLLPRDTFAREVMSSSLEHFITLKRRWKVSIAAMVMRCETLKLLSENQILYLNKQLSWRKMRAFEPLDDILVVESPNLFRQAITMLIDNRVQTVVEISNKLHLPIHELEDLCNLDKGTLSAETKDTIIDLSLKKENSLKRIK